MNAASPARAALYGVYAITDGPRRDLATAVEAALRGGVRVLQYRDKTSDHARRRAEASALQALCAAYSVPFLVNDDVELAAAIGADGVHLGEDDGDVPGARARLGTKAIIGVSCYDTLERARIATAQGADYLAFGAFFPTRSKQTTRRATPSLLREARRFGLPRVAIGGIDADNAAPLIEAGADCIAVISAVFGADDIEAAARRLAALFEPPGHSWQSGSHHP